MQLGLHSWLPLQGYMLCETDCAVLSDYANTTQASTILAQPGEAAHATAAHIARGQLAAAGQADRTQASVQPLSMVRCALEDHGFSAVPVYHSSTTLRIFIMEFIASPLQGASASWSSILQAASSPPGATVTVVAASPQAAADLLCLGMGLDPAQCSHMFTLSPGGVTVLEYSAPPAAAPGSAIAKCINSAAHLPPAVHLG